MNRLCTISSPLSTRSGYGKISRDLINNILDLYENEWEIKLISLNWGSCPMDVLNENTPENERFIKHLLMPPYQLNRQPDVHIHIGIPNEAQPFGKFNILYTAGIETDLISKLWIEGCNRMDLILLTSEHSKRVFENSICDVKNNNGIITETHKVTKPCVVLPGYINVDIFKHIKKEEIPQEIDTTLNNIKEDFCYLFVGQWLKGNYGEDRKQISTLIKVFCETFKDIKSPPALILKTSGATFSKIDRDDCLNKIRQVRATVQNPPNVYLLHGDLTDDEMNGLYNHPKVKCMVSFTSGEGLNLPLLEASQAQKPIISSGWSAMTDFLNPKDAILIGGELNKIPNAAVWENILIPDSKWFYIDINMAAKGLYLVHSQYGKFKDGGWRTAKNIRINYCKETIQNKTKLILEQYLPELPKENILELPELIKLPELVKN